MEKVKLIPTRAMTIVMSMTVPRSTSTSRAMTLRVGASDWRLRINRTSVRLVWLASVFIVVTRPRSISLLTRLLATLARFLMLLVLFMSTWARWWRWSRRVSLLTRHRIDWHERRCRWDNWRTIFTSMCHLRSVQHANMSHENTRRTFFRIIEASLLLITLATTRRYNTKLGEKFSFQKWSMEKRRRLSDAKSWSNLPKDCEIE